MASPFFCQSCSVSARPNLRRGQREKIANNRESRLEDAKRQAGLQFARSLVVQRGEVSDEAVTSLKRAGYSDGEISEIIASVAVSIFTNYFNHVAQTDVDFLAFRSR